eukprot:2511487-Prymnesium_polylepis.3
MKDTDMADPVDGEAATVRTVGLMDELGQVSHIFSDKTGTLTSNLMVLRRMLIGGVTYGVGDTAISRTLRGDNPAAAPMLSIEELPPWGGCEAKSERYVGFEEAAGAPSLFDALKALGPEGAARREIMINLAVNHSVMLEEVNGEVELSASSPDEQAFVAAAEYFGFEYLARDAQKGLVTIRDKMANATYAVELLEVFPYESSRKRMSVVVRLPPELLAACGGGSDVRIYVKGADSIMLTLLEPGSFGTSGSDKRQLEGLLDEWADIALRTLVWAKRELPHFSEWDRRYVQVPPDHLTTGPPDHRTTGPPDHRTTGPPDHLNSGPPDHPTT